MNKLFAVLLGGRAEGCHIELHDSVFVVGQSLEESYPRLVHKWFGIPKRLHIDASVELRYIDGHEVSISTEKPSNADKQLFFVNFGAYQPGFFGEIHQVNFYVAHSKTEALAKAKQELCIDLESQHCDDNLEIDDISIIDSVDNYYVQLTPSTVPHTLDIQASYRKLDVPEVMHAANALTI